MKTQTWARCLVVVVIGLLWAGSDSASGRASSGASTTRDALPGVDRPPGAQITLEDALLIDPWPQAAKLTASDRAPMDSFGYAVAISGDVVVVGVPKVLQTGTSSAGAAYVFVKPAAGWAGSLTQIAKLTTSDRAAEDWFGASVAISGDVIIVGAPRADAGGTVNAGAAYLFVKPGGGWSGNLTQTARLTAADKAVADEFGISIAISGDVIVVGAHQANPGGASHAGAVYVFTKPGGGWVGSLTQVAKLSASDRAGGDLFGSAVAISGDGVVVGAHEANPGGIIDAGAAYLFVKPTVGWAGSLTQAAKLTAAVKAKGDVFGASVAIHNTMVVVGATRSRADWNRAGTVYLFVKPGGGWAGSLTQTAELTPVNPVAGDYFGSAAAVSGDVVVVGAPAAVVGGSSGGAAQVFVKPSGGWTGTLSPTATLTAAGKVIGDSFGYAVAFSGNEIVVGAVAADLSGISDAGAAYLFRPSGAPAATYLPLVLRRQ